MLKKFSSSNILLYLHPRHLHWGRQHAKPPHPYQAEELLSLLHLLGVRNNNQKCGGSQVYLKKSVDVKHRLPALHLLHAVAVAVVPEVSGGAVGGDGNGAVALPCLLRYDESEKYCPGINHFYVTSG